MNMRESAGHRSPWKTEKRRKLITYLSIIWKIQDEGKVIDYCRESTSSESIELEQDTQITRKEF